MTDHRIPRVRRIDLAGTITTIAGDVSRYQYADSVHPTPYGYQLLAQYVAQQMVLQGWL